MRFSIALFTAAAMSLLAIGAQAHEPYPPGSMDLYEGPGYWNQEGPMGHPHMGWHHQHRGWAQGIGGHHFPMGGHSPHMGRGGDWQFPQMGGPGMGEQYLMSFGPQGLFQGGMDFLQSMVPIMIAIADTNGDGALSNEEHQAVHSRMFNLFDWNKDGKLTPSEVQSAFRRFQSSAQLGNTSAQPATPPQPGTANQ